MAVHDVERRRRPRIGVTTYSEPASWSYWREVPATIVPTAYVESVRKAGGLPLLIAPLPEHAEQPEEVIETLDGLIVVGGSDVTPASYGAQRHAAAGGFHAARDEVEIALIRAAIDADLPYLGICRGLQLLNVVRGGTLHQHLPEVIGDDLRHRPGLGQYGRHLVDVAAGSRLAGIVGTTTEAVTCHHQAPDRIGAGLDLVATDPSDGVIEALEDPSRTFCLGVQWHPEEDLDGPGQDLFRTLVAFATQHRELQQSERSPA